MFEKAGETFLIGVRNFGSNHLEVANVSGAYIFEISSFKGCLFSRRVYLLIGAGTYWVVKNDCEEKVELCNRLAVVSMTYDFLIISGRI